MALLGPLPHIQPTLALMMTLRTLFSDTDTSVLSPWATYWVSQQEEALRAGLGAVVVLSSVIFLLRVRAKRRRCSVYFGTPFSHVEVVKWLYLYFVHTSRDYFVDGELNVSNSDISYLWFSMMGPDPVFNQLL